MKIFGEPASWQAGLSVLMLKLNKILNSESVVITDYLKRIFKIKTNIVFLCAKKELHETELSLQIK